MPAPTTSVLRDLGDRGLVLRVEKGEREGRSGRGRGESRWGSLEADGEALVDGRVEDGVIEAQPLLSEHCQNQGTLLTFNPSLLRSDLAESLCSCANLDCGKPGRAALGRQKVCPAECTCPTKAGLPGVPGSSAAESSAFLRRSISQGSRHT